MEASVAPAAAATPVPDTTAEATPDRMFKFSETVDVGVGANVCEDKVSCSNPMHFHAWCRLPNQFQHQQIRDKAQAAKARRVRQFEDPESDLSVILDAEIAEVKGDKARMIDELVAKHLVSDRAEALRDLRERDEFKLIGQDTARIQELQKLPEDERPEGEYEELVKHLDEFTTALNEGVRDRQQPLRDSLEPKSEEELAKLIRGDRVARDAGAAFNTEYAFWEAYYCTLKPVAEGGIATDRKFTSTDVMREAAPEVIEELSAVFDELEASSGSGVAEGN